MNKYKPSIKIESLHKGNKIVSKPIDVNNVINDHFKKFFKARKRKKFNNFTNVKKIKRNNTLMEPITSPPGNAFNANKYQRNY